jgi:hypothetical protein
MTPKHHSVTLCVHCLSCLLFVLVFMMVVQDCRFFLMKIRKPHSVKGTLNIWVQVNYLHS